MELRKIPLIALCSGLASLLGFAGQEAAPSSHLVYNDASFDGDILINEVRVPRNGEAMYTYYETLGWSGAAGGYAGIQSHPKARNYIFSIWDHKEHEAPIRAVYHGPGTETEAFGGEGTGLKSWNFELGWDTDTWYTLVARCWPVGNHTFFGYWVRSGKSGEWTHLVTMDVAAKDAYFEGGNDSFIEDWLETGKKLRITHLRNGWKRRIGGEWHAFGSARYSVNSWDLTEGKRSFDFRTNWDGGVAKDAGGEYYYMKSGGSKTKPTTKNPSTFKIKRREREPGYLPIKLTSGSARVTSNGQLKLKWKSDAGLLPQFSVMATAWDNPQGTGKPLARIEKIEPHCRAIDLDLPEGANRRDVHVQLVCRDILDNTSPVLSLRAQ